jgi:hypothetical protein
MFWIEEDTMKIELTHDGALTVIEQEEATGVVTIRFTLADVDESGRTHPVIIHLTEHVEVVVPKLGVTPGVMDPDNELAVARVELMDGEVRAMLWDHAAVEHATESMVVTLIPAPDVI